MKENKVVFVISILFFLMTITSVQAALNIIDINMTDKTNPAPLKCWANKDNGGSNPCWYAFDTIQNGSPDNYWQPDADTSGTLGIDFGSGNETTVVQYSLDSYDNANYRPQDWTFEGSTDNITYHVLDAQSSYVFTASGAEDFFTTNSTTDYQYHRVVITASTGGALLVEEMRFWINDTPTAAPTNHSLENTFQQTLDTSTTVNSASYTDILAGTVTIDVNQSTSYFSAVVNLLPSASNTATCRITVDGTDYDSEVSRDNTASNAGSLSLSTSNVTLEDGSHDILLQCLKSGAGNYEITQATVIGHTLYDSNNVSINYDIIEIDNQAAGGASFSKVGEITHTTFENLTGAGLEMALVIDWDAQYNYTGSNEMNTYIDVNGTKCGYYPREGTVSTLGILGGQCIINNVANNTNFNITMWANGTGNVNAKLHIKDFILNTGESNSTSINNTAVSSTSYTKLDEVAINNTDHNSSDIFVKIGIPHKSNTVSAETSFQIRINNGTYNSTEFNRTTGTTNGITIAQYLFQGISAGDYTIELWGKADNADVTITGGEISAFISNDIGFTLNEFDITATDWWNATKTISTFSATDEDNNTFSTTTGTIMISTFDTLKNFTISASGYNNNTFLSHNTSGNLDARLRQTNIELNAYEKFTNATITSFNITTDNGSFTTTNGSIYLSPDANPKSWQIVSDDHITKNQSFTFSELDTGVYNFTDVATNQIRINATSAASGSPVLNFTAIALDLTNNYTENFTTTNGEILFNLTNSTWQVDIQADGFAFDAVNLTTNQTVTNWTFNLFSTNSINFTFIDEVTGAVVNFTTIELEFISDLFSYNYSTSTGTLFAELLSPTNYTLRYRDLSDIYYEDFYYFEVQNNSNSDLTIYMLNKSVYDNVTATVVDEVLNPVEGAFIRVLKYNVTDNTFKEIQVVQTNFEGVGLLHLTLNDEYYKFIIEFDSEVKKTTTATYIFGNDIDFQINVGGSIGEEYFRTFDVTQSLTYSNVTNNFGFTYSDPNTMLTEACMKVYTVSGSGQTLLNESCLTTSAGTILINAPEVNGTTYRADVFINLGTEDQLTQSLYKSFSETANTGFLGPLMVALMTVVFIFVGIWNLSVALILAPVPMILASLIGIWEVAVTIGITFEIIGILIALYIYKYQGV